MGMNTELLRSMTFNIRQDMQQDGENNWIYRKEMVASIIRFHQTDIVGLQEALYNQMVDLEELLPEYGWVGVGRGDGVKEDEFAPIFYLKTRFDVIDQGTFWLSETPEVWGSIGWDAACVRIVTWAKFQEKISGEILYFFNTHFDHVGQVAMVESSHLLLSRIEEIAGDYPVIVTGDFNNTETSEAYKILVGKKDIECISENKNYLFDSNYLSNNKHHGPTFTFHGFHANELMDIENRKGLKNSFDLSSPIDFIFVNNHIKVFTHGILADNWDGKYPSDHMPVVADIYITSYKDE